MMHQNKRLIGPHQIAAWLTKKWDRDSMDTSVKVFKNLKEMGRRYVKMAKEELKKRKNSGGDHIDGHFSVSEPGLKIRGHYRDPLGEYERSLQDQERSIEHASSRTGSVVHETLVQHQTNVSET